MKREEFKRLLLELLLGDEDVADAVLAARRFGEARDSAESQKYIALNSLAYLRAREALRRLQEELSASQERPERFGDEDQ